MLYEKLKLNIVLWQYSEDTPVEKLLRHHRSARWIVKLWAFSSVGIASTMAMGVLLDFLTVEIIVMFIFGGVALLLIIPALFAYPIMDEIEQTLEKQGNPLPDNLAMANKPPMWVARMWFWFTLAILAPWLIHKFTS